MRTIAVGFLVVVIFVGLAYAADGVRPLGDPSRSGGNGLFIPTLEDEHSAWNGVDARPAAKRARTGGVSHTIAKRATPAKADSASAGSEQDAGLAFAQPWVLALAGFVGLCLLAAIVWSAGARQRARSAHVPVFSMQASAHRAVRKPATQTAFVVSLMQTQLNEATLADSAAVAAKPFRRAA